MWLSRSVPAAVSGNNSMYWRSLILKNVIEGVPSGFASE